MVRYSATVVAAIMMMAPPLQQRLTDAEVEAAIRAGRDNEVKDFVRTCVAAPPLWSTFWGSVRYPGLHTVTTSTNAGRIAFLAAEARRLQKPFTSADVPDELRTPGVYVYVQPHQPKLVQSGLGMPRFESAPLIAGLVLQSKVAESTVLRPSSEVLEPIEWVDESGRVTPGNRATAVFDWHAVKNLPAGDVDIVITTRDGERRCVLASADRSRLLK